VPDAEERRVAEVRLAYEPADLTISVGETPEERRFLKFLDEKLPGPGEIDAIAAQDHPRHW
jgi:hypothetical protein